MLKNIVPTYISVFHMYIYLHSCRIHIIMKLPTFVSKHVKKKSPSNYVPDTDPNRCLFWDSYCSYCIHFIYVKERWILNIVSNYLVCFSTIVTLKRHNHVRWKCILLVVCEVHNVCVDGCVLKVAFTGCFNNKFQPKRSPHTCLNIIMSIISWWEKWFVVVLKLFKILSFS